MERGKLKLRQKMALVVNILKEKYPSAECALRWGGEDPWRLLVMGRLSAQCTDARVNEVCVPLFEAFPTAHDMAMAKVEQIEAIIRPCGLFHTKANDLKLSSMRLIEVYGGVLPQSMEELLTFPGVGRKIANLLRGDVFGQPAVVTDTHCIRICGRLGFYPENEKTPHKIEKILTELIEPAESADFCHRIVWFGREVCTARSPACHSCPLAEAGLCAHFDAVQKKAKKRR